MPTIKSLKLKIFSLNTPLFIEEWWSVGDSNP
jgi:hypothetical protein